LSPARDNELVAGQTSLRDDSKVEVVNVPAATGADAQS
jgi:hypothetical protein